jgi:hypothetical protein
MDGRYAGAPGGSAAANVHGWTGGKSRFESNCNCIGHSLNHGVFVTYRLLADLVVVFHLLFIFYGLFGGLLGLWRRWALLLHLPVAVWIALIEFTGWICPLTPLENQLRLAGGAAGYEGGFIERYLIPVIYPAGLTPQMQTWLGLIAIGINLTIYAFVLYRWNNRNTA